MINSIFKKKIQLLIVDVCYFLKKNRRRLLLFILFIVSNISALLDIFFWLRPCVYILQTKCGLGWFGPPHLILEVDHNS